MDDQTPLDNGDAGRVEPEGWLRDITEDDAYERFQRMKELPDEIQGLETRTQEYLAPISERLDALQKSLSTQVTVDPKLDEFVKTISDWDENLAKVLGPAIGKLLQESIRVNPLNAEAISPHINDPLQKLAARFNEALVLSVLDREDVAEAIPDSKDGVFVPTNDRQRLWVKWYSKQPVSTRRALSEWGPGYIQAYKSFKRWEATQVKQETEAAENKTARLAGGQQPSANGRAGGGKKRLQTLEEGFNSVFDQGN